MSDLHKLEVQAYQKLKEEFLKLPSSDRLDTEISDKGFYDDLGQALYNLFDKDGELPENPPVFFIKLREILSNLKDESVIA